MIVFPFHFGYIIFLLLFVEVVYLHLDCFNTIKIFETEESIDIQLPISINLSKCIKTKNTYAKPYAMFLLQSPPLESAPWFHPSSQSQQESFMVSIIWTVSLQDGKVPVS